MMAELDPEMLKKARLDPFEVVAVALILNQQKIESCAISSRKNLLLINTNGDRFERTSYYPKAVLFSRQDSISSSAASIFFFRTGSMA